MERCGFGTKAGEAVAVGFDVLVWGSNVRRVRFMLGSTHWMGIVNDDVIVGPDLSE